MNAAAPKRTSPPGAASGPSRAWLPSSHSWEARRAPLVGARRALSFSGPRSSDRGPPRAQATGHRRDRTSEPPTRPKWLMPRGGAGSPRSEERASAPEHAAVVPHHRPAPPNAPSPAAAAALLNLKQRVRDLTSRIEPDQLPAQAGRDVLLA